MANIGTFKKSGHEFQGKIVTLSLQSKGVRIVPDANRASDNAPSHRVYVGRAEIGAAWSKRSNEGRDRRRPDGSGRCRLSDWSRGRCGRPCSAGSG